MVTFANDVRLDNENKMDVDQLDLDALLHPEEGREFTDAEWSSWETKMAEHKAACDDQLDYMNTARKGNGKGKGGKGKGSGGAKAGAGKGTETRDCHWCPKKGHLIANCRRKLAGLPNILPKGKSAASLEKDGEGGDWQGAEQGRRLGGGRAIEEP